MSNKGGFKSIMYLASFVGLVLIAISLIIVKVAPSVAGACSLIANIIAYSMVAFFSYLFVSSKRNVAYYITWIVSIVIVIVMMILI